jgi:hypothetical protein
VGVLLGGPGYSSDLWTISTLLGTLGNVKRGNSGQNRQSEYVPNVLVSHHR